MRGPGWLLHGYECEVHQPGGRAEGHVFRSTGRARTCRSWIMQSAAFNGYACTYEGFYSRSGACSASSRTAARMAGPVISIYDRTGRMQYRVRYRTEEAAVYIRDATSLASEMRWSMERIVRFLSFGSIWVVMTATYLPFRRLTENCGSKAGLVNASSRPRGRSS